MIQVGSDASRIELTSSRNTAAGMKKARNSYRLAVYMHVQRRTNSKVSLAVEMTTSPSNMVVCHSFDGDRWSTNDRRCDICFCSSHLVGGESSTERPDMFEMVKGGLCKSFDSA